MSPWEDGPNLPSLQATCIPKVIFSGPTLKQTDAYLVCAGCLLKGCSKDLSCHNKTCFFSLPMTPIEWISQRPPSQGGSAQQKSWRSAECGRSDVHQLQAQPKRDGDTELRGRRSLARWRTAWTCTTNLARVKSKLFYHVEPMRFKKPFQPPLLVCAQATAMQMEIPITFNETEWNLSTTVLLQPDSEYFPTTEKKIFFLSFMLTHSTKKNKKIKNPVLLNMSI